MSKKITTGLDTVDSIKQTFNATSKQERVQDFGVILIDIMNNAQKKSITQLDGHNITVDIHKLNRDLKKKNPSNHKIENQQTRGALVHAINSFSDILEMKASVDHKHKEIMIDYVKTPTLN
ncbi:MAG: hypothetical protein GY793_09105 [Proteobacteria bacterium]|nr:hypothetical protein [Pseudomonadota bacterium]